MIKKIKGIVTKEIDYKDTSKIIEVITRNGIYSIIAKGAKNVKNSNFKGTNFLSYGEFCIYENKSISTLKSVDLINSFKNTLKDIVKISASTYLVKLCIQVYKQNMNYEIFDLLLSALIKIDNEINALGVVNIVEIKLLKYLGLKLNLDNCAICGSKKIVYLSLDYSGYLCSNCTNLKMDMKVLRLFKMYDMIDLNKLDKINVSKDVMMKIDKFIYEYYEKYTGIYLQSKKLFNELMR